MENKGANQYKKIYSALMSFILWSVALSLVNC